MNELAYRALVLVCFTAFLWVRVEHFRKLGGGGEEVRSRAEGPVLRAVDRGLVAASVLGVAVYIVAPGWIGAFALPLPDGPRLLGLGFCAWGILLFRETLLTLGRNWSMSLVIKRDHQLVTEGPYQWVRHPMYTAFALCFGGFFLLTANALIGLSALLGYGLVKMVIRPPREERLLLEAFGDEYRAYLERTGRFLGIRARLRARSPARRASP